MDHSSSCSYPSPSPSSSKDVCTSTPRRSGHHGKQPSTPCGGCQPRTPSSLIKSPNTTGDRFIPAREEQPDIAHFYITQQPTIHSSCTPSSYVSALEESIFEGRQSKILSFKTKAPVPQTHEQNLLSLYSNQSKKMSPHKTYRRYISHTPLKILDAPDISNDFYLNILDWGHNNILAVALGNCVYLWNATTTEIFQLPYTNPEPVTSVSWMKGLNCLAIGTEDSVQIWDVDKQRRVRSMNGHSSRVGVLSWNNNDMLSSGSRDSTIINHDVRLSHHHVSTLAHHTQEICGLKWNSSGSLLASGGNDNVANVWDVRNTAAHSVVNTPLYTLPHAGAVKALDWCPFQSNLLTTGGGSSDRCIRFWSSSTGALLNSTDTSSQVCQLLWSTHYKELLSSHGFNSNSLTVWKYPSMHKVAKLDGHTDRVLYLSLSPDGETVVSAAGDETLRFWKVFEKEDKGSTYGSNVKPKQLAIPSNTMIR